jgi:drug/metabolite transporter (DMT)-like permease
MTAEKEARSTDLVKAAGWMGLALLSFALLAVSARQLLDTMGAFQILFLRSGVGLAMILVYALPRRPGFARTTRLRLHLLRNLFHYGGQVCWITALGLLPLAVVFAMEFTTPIWAAVLAAVFLGERLNRGRIVAIALGFAGILVILRPGSVPIAPEILVPLAAAVGFAVSVTATKGLTRSDSPVTILFYMLLIQVVLGAVPAGLTWQPVAAGDLPWLVVAAVTGLTAHYGMTRALQQADATLVMPMDFLRLPLIAVVGLVFYREALEPAVLVGAAMIFSGSYYSLSREHRRRLSARAIRTP